MQVQDRNRTRRVTTALGIVCFVLQLALAPQLSLGNGHINFCLIYALCIALARGGSRGVVVGFCAGLVFDLSTTGPIGLMALLLTICSYVMGFEVRNRLAEDPESSYIQAAVACLAVSAAYSLTMLVMGETSGFLDALFLRALPTAVLTFVCFLPFAAFLSHKGRAGLGLSGSVGRIVGPGSGRGRR